MAPALRLVPHVRPVRRAGGELQFGLCPEHGMVLSGLTEDETVALLALSESTDLPAWLHDAARAGVSPGRLQRFLDELGGRGLLHPPGRSGGGRREPGEPRQVCVLGRGALATAVRDQLAGAGVASVADRWDPVTPADVVVLVVADAVPAAESVIWPGPGRAHLPVISRGHQVLIGPLARVGAGPCLHCLDLHRTDRDRAWPAVLTQLAPDLTELAAEVHADPALAGAAAGLAAMVVRSHLDGCPVPPGKVWEVSLPWPDVVTRCWSPHPRCRCQVR